MKRIFKIIAIAILIAFIIIQLFRSSKNTGIEVASNHISAIHSVPENIEKVLKVSCYDCHSNTTHYPWYDKVQPVAWFLEKHILEGKKELNFSEFASYPPYRRYKKFKEIQQQIREGEMPLFSYTIPHRNAVLSETEKSALINWSAGAIKEMETAYPPDSLVKPKK